MGLFDFFYGNSKTLHKEVKKMIGQCDGFLHYSIALSEDASKLWKMIQEAGDYLRS